MNRIFKTVWNMARRALVVVNEKTGIGQSRCAAVGQGTESTAGSDVYEEQKKYTGVPSAVCLALASVFVFWGGNAGAYEVVYSVDQGGARIFGENGGYDPEDPLPDPDPSAYFMQVMTPTESEGWKYLDNSTRYQYLGADWNQFNMNVWNDFVDIPEANHFYLVFGANVEWTEAGDGYQTTSNLFTVGENPADLNVNAENFSDRDEVGFWGSAGNFSVEDGKTLVLFGEAPLNGSYLGEGKTGTVRDGTLIFGLPYKFSEFQDGLSSGDTGKLLLGDGAKVVFRNGVYTTSRIDIQPESNVRITINDTAEVNLQSVVANAIYFVAEGDGAVGVIENAGFLIIVGGSVSDTCRFPWETIK